MATLVPKSTDLKERFMQLLDVLQSHNKKLPDSYYQVIIGGIEDCNEIRGEIAKNSSEDNEELLQEIGLIEKRISANLTEISRYINGITLKDTPSAQELNLQEVKKGVHTIVDVC